MDHVVENTLTWCPSPASPASEGRPHIRSKQLRQHPYRRLTQQQRQHSSVRAASVNGNGNTATLPAGLNGLNGYHHSGSGLPTPVPELQQLMRKVAAGDVDPRTAAMQLRELGSGVQKVTDLAVASGWDDSSTPEAIVWAPGKSPAQIAIAMQRLAQGCGAAMAARVTKEVAHEIEALLPEAKYHVAARALLLTAVGKKKQERLPGTVAIISGGAAEDFVAEEARAASGALGCYAYKLVSSSLSGILPNLPAVQSADVVIVVAGQDGALPAVISGLVQSPVIAVPTSAGDGVVASAPGISLVNTDNGLAAAVIAARILRTASRLRERQQPSAANK